MLPPRSEGELVLLLYLRPQHAVPAILQTLMEDVQLSSMQLQIAV